MLGYLSFESVPLTESGLQSGGNGADNDNELLLSLARSNGLSHREDHLLELCRSHDRCTCRCNPQATRAAGEKLSQHAPILQIDAVVKNHREAK